MSITVRLAVARLAVFPLSPLVRSLANAASANPLNRHLIAKFLFYGLDRHDGGVLNALDTMHPSFVQVGDQKGPTT